MGKAIFMIITAIIMIVTAVIGFNMNRVDGAATACEDTEIRFMQDEPACYHDNTIYFNINNDGGEITGLKMYLEADYNISITIKNSMSAGAPGRKKLSFGQALGRFQALTLRPIVNENGIQTVCRDKWVRAELSEC